MSGTSSTSAVGDFTIGRDCEAILVVGGFGRVNLSEVEGFSAKPVYEKPRIKPLNKRPIEKALPMGYEISFDIARANGSVERLQAYLDSSYWSGNGVPVGTLYQYVRNPDGSTLTMRYDNFSVIIGDLGDYKADAPVKQSVTGFASQMTVV